MDYEKKYKETIEKIKELQYNHRCSPVYTEIQEKFPELVESVDEKIRKQIIGFITYSKILDETKKNWIAWLEKQKDMEAKLIISDEGYNKAFQDGIEEVLTNPHKYGLEKQGEQKGIQYLDTSDCVPWSDEQTRINLINFLKSLGATEIPQASYNRYLSYLKKQGEQNPIVPKFRIGDKLKKGYLTYTVEDIDEDSYKLQAYSKDGDKGCTVFLTIGYEKDYELVEQKPTDKVEPKFKVGDWVVYCGKTCKITGLNNGIFTITNQDGSFFFNQVKSTMEPVFHHWTIQDAKDGDVLHSIGWSNDCIFIFNGLDKWKFDTPNGDRAVATGYCCLSVSADNMEFGIQGPDCIEVNTVKPATKIQRDLLFQKMKEAGYEWDAEKLELKKIEQKSAEWSEEDKMMLQYAIEHFERQKRNCIEDGGRRKVMQEFIDWLKSLKDRYTWKPSEEQMRILNLAIRCGIQLGTQEEIILTSLFNDLKKLKE